MPRNYPHTIRTVSGAASILLLCAFTPENAPVDEVVFSALPHSLQAKQSSAPNDIIRQQMRSEAPKTFCASFKKMAYFRNWVASIKHISASSLDGTAKIELDIGNDINLSQDRITSSDNLYKIISQLREGQTVNVSGTFDHNNDESSCIYYFGPFEVHLSNVKPL